MDETLLQLGLAAQPHKLAASSSYIQRGQPAYSTTLASGWTSNGASSTSANGSNGAPYVTQLAQARASGADVLLSYADDDVFRQHDKASLKVLSSFKWSQGGACTSLKTAASEAGYVTSGRNGVVGYWDTRQKQTKPSAGAEMEATLSFAGPSRAPYTALDIVGNAIAAGTELQGVDARIDIWDVRKPTAPVLTYEETHSDDVTSLAFHPTAAHVLLSGSSDALLAVSDTRQANEDDSVVGVINTEASVARAGWGGSGHTFAKAEAAVDGEDVDPASVAHSSLPPLGAFWAVSDMQTVGIWEADAFSELLALSDVRQTQSIGALALADEVNDGTSPWQSEYIIDASADASLLENVEGVGLFCGEQNGGMVLIEVPNTFTPKNATSSRRDWLLHCRTGGGHGEVVRSIVWDAENYTLFSGGEDGRICAWGLGGDRTDGVPLRSRGAHYKDEQSTGAGPARGKGANAIPMAPRGAAASGPDRQHGSDKFTHRTTARDRVAYRPY